MLKVWFVAANNIDLLTRSINEFIADKKVVDIKFQSLHYYTQYKNGMPSAGEFCERVMVLYEE